MIAVLKAELRQQRLRGDCINFATSFATSDSLPQELSRSYLRYRRNRKMKTSNYFKALRHNGVNYSSVLHMLLKQRWENYLQTRPTAFLTIPSNELLRRSTDNEQLSSFSEISGAGKLRLTITLIVGSKKLTNGCETPPSLSRSITTGRTGEKNSVRRKKEEKEEKEEEEEDWLVRGYAEMEANRIEEQEEEEEEEGRRLARERICGNGSK